MRPREAIGEGTVELMLRLSTLLLEFADGYCVSRLNVRQAAAAAAAAAAITTTAPIATAASIAADTTK